MNCGRTNIPIGSKVKIVKNTGNECEPFLNLIGIATHPFRKGCKLKDWIGVEFEQQTIYGKQFNFNLEEVEILQND
jgi:hypothetical protein